MATIMLTSQIVPDVAVPDYVAFGNMIETACDLVIKIMGAIAAALLLKKLWIGNQKTTWELMNEKKKAQEDGIRSVLDEINNKLNKEK